MLFRNTLAQSSRLVIGQVCSVIVAPLLIGRLGLTAFGVWAITGSAASYVSLLDFGITRSLSRFVALHDSRGDRLAIQRVMAVGFIAVTVVGVVAVGAAVTLAPAINDALSHPISDGAMRIVLFSSASLLTLQLYGQVCDSLPAGMLRYIPSNIAGIFGIACNFTASVVVLLVDPRLTSYALANAAAAVPAVIASFIAMIYVAGRPFLAVPNRPVFREIVGFGFKTQVSTMSALINYQTDKVVIAVTVGVRAAASFEIGSRVALAVRELAVITTSAMIPQATAEIARHGTAVIRSFYQQWSTRVLSLSVGVFALASLCSPYLLTAWLGETPKDSRGVLIGLSMGYLAWMTTGVPSTVSIGAGRPGMAARNAVESAVLNLILTVILAPLFGLWGVLAGTVASMVVVAVIFVVRFHRAFDVPAAAFRDAAVGPFALGAALALPLALLVVLVLPMPDDRLGAAGLLVVVGGSFGLAYWYGATALNYLPAKLRLPGVRPRVPVGATAPPS